MQTASHHHDIIRLIEGSLQLPSPPAIAVQILNAVKQDDGALSALGDVIAADPALTARMLNLANSDMFSRNGGISNIHRAMVILGTDMIKNIALSFVIAKDSRSKNKNGFDMDRFWKRSIAAAVAAELLSRARDRQDDDIFVTALLKNIGMLVLSGAKGKEYHSLTRRCPTGSELFGEERKLFGFNHAQVGFALLNHWKLPECVSLPILFQAAFDQTPQEYRTTVDILLYADRIATICLDYEASILVPTLRDEFTEKFGFAAEKTYSLLDDAALKSKEIIAFFDIDVPNILPYSSLLEQANTELARINLSKEQMILELKVARDKAERMALQLKESNTRLKELVFRDGLTELYNHRYFHEILNKEMLRSKRYLSSLSLIFFDVDHFKNINDKYGHPVGDQVLMNISKAVAAAVRPSDIVSRYGGDEFAIILPETGREGVRVFASRLRRCVEGIATRFNDQTIYVTISAGVATTTPETPEITKDQLIMATDQALYLSKSKGRNQVSVLDAITG